MQVATIIGMTILMQREIAGLQVAKCITVTAATTAGGASNSSSASSSGAVAFAPTVEAQQCAMTAMAKAEKAWRVKSETAEETHQPSMQRPFLNQPDCYAHDCRGDERPAGSPDAWPRLHRIFAAVATNLLLQIVLKDFDKTKRKAPSAELIMERIGE